MDGIKLTANHQVLLERVEDRMLFVKEIPFAVQPGFQVVAVAVQWEFISKNPNAKSNDEQLAHALISARQHA